MISKEKLLNSYIENDNGELKMLYMDALSGHGVTTCAHFNPSRKYLECANACSGLAVYGVGELFSISKGSKQLTLADFKPKTKVEYFKLVGVPKLSELFEIFEADELYTKSMHCHKQVCSIEAVIKLFSNAGAYRKVETEVTWQDELISFITNCSDNSNLKYNVSLIDDDSGMDLSEDEFIEMCHLVSNANK